MKVKEIIRNLNPLFRQSEGIDAAILYGSHARGDANFNSDIDIKLIVNDDFISEKFVKQINSHFGEELLYSMIIDLRKKVVFYLKDSSKLEFAICKNLDEIKRDYTSSQIQDIKSSILFEQNIEKTNLEVALLNLANSENNANISAFSEENIDRLVNKFLYEFESCSIMHKRSDAYRFYFFYNICVHLTFQLYQLSKNDDAFNFFPRNFTSKIADKNDLENIYALNGTLFLPEVNDKKRKLLDFFYQSITNLISSKKLESIKQFCETVYQRDYLWNFRDISKVNPKIKEGVVFRSASLTFFQNDDFYADFLKEKNIGCIIDLRADREIDEHPYKEEKIIEINYSHCPFDPWNQPDWFKETNHYGTNDEIAYRFFALCCNEFIKKSLETILYSEKASVVHCFAGKDITGIIITLLHLLVDSPIETVYEDYLASESDVEIRKLDFVLGIIEEKGGIIKYLKDCGLTIEQLNQLKAKLIK